MGCRSNSCLYQIFCFLFVFISSFLPLSSSLSPPPHLCHPEHCSALLNFSSSFSLFTNKGYCSDSSHKTESWNESTDCCRWEGVTCDNETGSVIGLDLTCAGLNGALQSNSSLFSLQNLRRLNLATNDFNGSVIPSEFSKLRSLNYLNLSSTGLFGSVLPDISLLSEMASLDLSWTNLWFKNDAFNMLVHNLTKLENLILDFVDLSDLVVPNSFLNLSVSLKHLSLSFCQLQGYFPSRVFHLSSLEKINLNYNDYLNLYVPKTNWTSSLSELSIAGTSFLKELPDSIGNLKNLETLNLRNCQFMGSLPPSLGNLTKISFLDFASNYFVGQIPDVFGNLNKLSYLDFSSNSFSGFLPSSAFNLTSLTYIDFSYNLLEGTLPYNVSGHSNVKVLSLSKNSFVGRVPSWLFSLPSLKLLYLSSNKLDGPIDPIQGPNRIFGADLSKNEIQGLIPSSFFELVNLAYLDLSSNNLSGNIKSSMLLKLRNVEQLDLSNNKLLSLSSGSNDVNFTFPKLQRLFFSSSNIQQFPYFLKASKELVALDLSDNKIQGSIHKREAEGWESLSFLNLSHNYLTCVEQVPGKNLRTLDLRSNSLQGPLLAPPWTIINFFMSENKLVREIPSQFCNLSSLAILDLAKNNLSGIIPECLVNSSSYLSVMDLRMNNFYGNIPRTYFSGFLRTLNLNGNQLEGSIPQSLVNCSCLEVLDLGNNYLSDTFPHWLGMLPNLKVLVLRSNRFYGDIQNINGTSSFSCLRIIDLSQNDFSGHMPAKLFENLNAMKYIDEEEARQRYIGDYYYQDSIIVTMKGLEMELVRVLTIFTTIDFSNNKFKGHIPEVLGELKSLILLNFSHNSLTEYIPPSLGELAALESLDLSSNRLEGRIPYQLTELTFLSVVNLSQNNLEGPVPRGNQFDTFTNESYIGNRGLCGFPLSKECGNDEEPKSPPSDEDDDASSTLLWKIAMMGYGCGLVFGLSTGYIVFTTGKPHWLVKMIDRVGKRRKQH